MADDTFVAFDTSLGDFVVELFDRVTPRTVANFLGYVNNPTPGDNYDNGFFHRLVSGFVLQGGGYDLSSNAIVTIPTAAPVASEYNASKPNVAGTIAMALVGNDPNSATDQFFFNLVDNSSLLDNTSDGGPFTAFGQVVENWSVVQAIAALPVVNLGSDAAFTQLPVQGTVPDKGPAVANLVQYSVRMVQPIANARAAQPAIDDAAAAPFSGVVLTDPGNPTGAGDRVGIIIEDASGGANATLGALSLPVAGAGTLIASGSAGGYVLGSFADIASLQLALQSLVFTPAPVASGASPETVQFDLMLQSPGGAFDNQDSGLLVSHDAGGVATITGADSVTRALLFGTGPQGAVAQQLLGGVSAASALFVDSAGAYIMGDAQTAAIDAAADAVTLTGGAAANETIAAGAGPFSFQAGTGGSGTVVTGAGADSIYLPGGGDWTVELGAGADTVVAATGDVTITTGAGGSFAFLGSGASLVVSAGADTILGASGSATVSASGASADEVFALGGQLRFIAGTGASTVVGGTAGATLFGGAGNTLMFGDGATRYVGAGGTDTVVGLNGSVAAQGGAGGGVFFGGTAGGNLVTAGAGPVTAIGGGAGDVLTATGSASDLFAGGPGAETLTGAGSTGNNTFFAGFGPETLVGGTGNTALVAGAGADLLQAGGGLTLFLFVAGQTAGAADTITGFDPSQDFVKLAGYSGSELQTVRAATVVNGSVVVELPDATTITFAGVTQLGASSFT